MIPIENKKLFLQYAIPCGEVLVARGNLDPKILDKLNHCVVDEKDIKLDVAELFPVASKMCEMIAKSMGKDAIDEEVIRRYFLFEHEKAIRWRAKIFPDINTKDCLVYPGRVLKTGEEFVVKTPAGERILKKSLDPELKKGEFVTTHYDYVSEKIHPGLARKLLRKRHI